MSTISVIMPVFNQKTSYLKQAIQSILNQTFRDFDFIIIDDGSTSPDQIILLAEFEKIDDRIKILKNERNLGIVSSLNKGVVAATGKFVARMDSDDIALPHRLEKQLIFLNKNPDYDLVGAWATVIDENDKVIGELTFPRSNDDIRSTLLMRNPVLHPTWLARKSLFETEGLYNEKATSVEDYEFLLRITRHHRLANLPEKLLKYRFNTSGISFKNNKRQEKNALILRIMAIRKYGYPLWQSIYLLRPIFFYLFIPSFVKKLLIRLSFKSL